MRREVRARVEWLQGLLDYFVQTMHSGTIRLKGDTAVGHAYVSEFGWMRDGSSELSYAVYHDRYRRTEDGWKFSEHIYKVRYLDTTPLAGSVSRTAGTTGQRIDKEHAFNKNTTVILALPEPQDSRSISHIHQ